MKISQCPSCGKAVDLDHAVNDQSAKQLLMLMASLSKELGYQIVLYIALFRNGSDAVGWAKSYKIAIDVCAVCADHKRLANALDKSITKHKATSNERLNDHSMLLEILSNEPFCEEM